MAAKKKSTDSMVPPAGRTPVAVTYDPRRRQLIVVCNDRSVWSQTNTGKWIAMEGIPA